MTFSNIQLDSAKIRQDFPILQRVLPNGQSLTFLDSAASSQKPIAVLDAMQAYYQLHNANVHRGIYTLAEEATALYESARQQAAQFLNAPASHEIIFTRNATEAINLVAASWGNEFLRPGDLILTTQMEHHANLVPWQMLAQRKQARLAFVPLDEEGCLDLQAYRALLAESPRLVAFSHASNVLGTINPVAEMTALAHAAGAVVLVDGAQGAPHLPVDVQAMGVDFYVFSAHKACGPTGIGVLYGRSALLEAMPPYMGGGDMIRKVTYAGFTCADLPYKFEAGTPAIAEAVGMGAALAYLQGLGMPAIAAHEQEHARLLLSALAEVPGLRVLGPQRAPRTALASFVFERIHPHDVAQVLDEQGVAVRAGHHCAMPLHDLLNVPASSRASLYIYNTAADIERLLQALHRVVKIFG